MTEANADPTDWETIRYDHRGDAAWITLDRPEARNALAEAGWRDLTAALERAAEEARVAVLAGAGEAFCAGDDVATLANLETAAEGRALGDVLYGALFGIERLPVPVVAAVEGPAYGGGCELVAACDLAVAAPGATFALPEARVGAYPPYAAARPGAFGGAKRLLELALTGEPIEAPAAADRGLVTRVDPDVPETVASLVDAITAAPRASIRLVKRHARVARAGPDERDRVRDGFAEVATTPTCTAAARAFFEN